MLLHTLLKQFDPELPTSPYQNFEIRGVQEDSRKIKRGDLFIARSGTRVNGASFVEDAHARGTAAIVCETKLDGCRLPQIPVKNAGRAASILANLVLGQPSHTVKTVGITGTNGKTTTAYLVRHLLTKVNSRCGMIGTVEIDDGRSRREATMTTPGPCELAELFASMAANGCRSCAMEVSSHALDQQRVAGIRFAAAGFTNLTGDHLDYHKTMDQYAGAKAGLFESLSESAVAAVNAEDQWSGRMVRDCGGRIIRYGFGPTADYRALDIAINSQGTHFILKTPDGQTEVSLGLIGRHNIENALLAAALVGETFGLTVHQIAAGLRDAQGAPGRLQAVRAGQPFAVLVDYAHTDDALENVLSALRTLTRGKLRVLFGCGGDRDRTKRPRMARTAEKWADAIYVTSDNPRTEEPQSILDQIVAGFSAEGRAKATVEIDRRAAIQRILADASEGDVVLLAGKGHENYQIIGTEKRHFDDVEEAGKALRSRAAA